MKSIYQKKAGSQGEIGRVGRWQRKPQLDILSKKKDHSVFPPIFKEAAIEAGLLHLPFWELAGVPEGRRKVEIKKMGGAQNLSVSFPVVFFLMKGQRL